MRRLAAQYIFTSAGAPLKRGVITAGADGTIIQVEDTGGRLAESASTVFYNGIIIPGLVNAHSHLELSHMSGLIPPGTGLDGFIAAMRAAREAPREAMLAAARQADAAMYAEGVEACGDISNTPLTLELKSGSPVRYHTFIELFGLDPAVAAPRMEAALSLSAAAAAAHLPAQVTPHSLYSLSAPLSRMVREQIRHDSVISLHFLESDDERTMTSRHAGRALELARLASRLILVHNTVITRDEAVRVASAGNTWFCLCPSSNLHISGMMPPVAMLREVTPRITAGTDSLASSGQLSMLTELRLLHEAAPELPLDEIIRWGTINGARALQMERELGSIEPGKRPGLLLIEPVDLVNMRLLPDSRIRRLF